MCAKALEMKENKRSLKVESIQVTRIVVRERKFKILEWNFLALQLFSLLRLISSLYLRMSTQSVDLKLVY